MALSKAKEMLESGGYTCVLTDGNSLYTSMLRGVKPLVQFLDQNIVPPGFYAADKVVGRATAYLYVLLGIRELYAQVISEPAADVLREKGIQIHYGQMVPNIINRRGDGICPFEEAVMKICEADEAYTAVLQKMRELNIAI